MATGWTIFLVVLGVVMLLMAAADQRAMWWNTAAWRYRNPEAAEPSDAAFALERATLVFFALIILAVPIIPALIPVYAEYQRTRSIVPRVQQVADTLRAADNWPASDQDEKDPTMRLPDELEPGRRVEVLLDDASDLYQALQLISWQPSSDFRTHTFDIGPAGSSPDNDRRACLTVTGIGEPEPTQFPPIRDYKHGAFGLTFQDIHLDPKDTPAYREVQTTVAEGDCPPIR